MTVRVSLNNGLQRRSVPARTQYRESKSRFAEYFFLLLGLIAVDYYIWVNVDAAYYQAYQSWSFDQNLQHQPISFLRFVEDKLGLSVDSQAGAVQSAEDSGRESSALPPAAVIGRVEVPRLHLSAMVREGTEEETLRRAVGHIPSTALPGRPGNVGLAGHRDTFFRGLRSIKKDDHIVVSTLHGSYEYQVETLKVVMPDDVEVLQPEPGVQSLTLVTCYPFYYVGSAPKRFIVRAREISPSPLQPAGS